MRDTNEPRKFAAIEVFRKPEDIPALAAGVTSPVISWARDIIEDYLEISRKRIDNSWALSNLQLHLLTDLMSNEKIIAEYKKALGERAAREDTAPHDAKEADNDVRFIKSRIYAHQLVTQAIRCVGDGLAWRLLDYDRAVLHILASNQYSGGIKDNEGLIAELQVWAETADSTTDKSIINGITNCLRVGDVTLIRKDGTIELKEVKQSKQRGARITRQRERLYQTVNCLNTGIGDLDGTTVRIESLETRVKNYLPQIRQLAMRASSKGFATEAIGDFLIVNAMDFDRVENIQEAIEALESRHKSIREEWKRSGDLVIPHPGMNLLGFSRNIAPLSIFPFEPKICTDLMFGKLYLTAHLNLSSIMRLFVHRDWKVTDSVGNFVKKNNRDQSLPSSEIPAFTVQKGPLTLKIPFSMVGRIPMEGLSPTTLVIAAEEILSLGSSPGAFATFPNFVYEKEQWK